MARTKDDNFEVTYPSDWLETPLAAFSEIEEAFRCHVCKDFFESPMLTSCSHTFCSPCIRRCLSEDGKCPLCRANDQQTRLRVNTALREAVDVFVKSRPAALNFAKTQAASAPVSERSFSKRKASPPDEQNIVEPEGNKRVRMSTRASKSRGAHRTSTIMQHEAGLEETMEDEATDHEPEPGYVKCPVCAKQVKEFLINQHLDNNCVDLQKTPQASRFSNVNVAPIAFGRPHSPAAIKSPERLSELSYHFLKDQALRKKLSDLGISNHGTKDQLIRRHKEWVVIFNANLDSAHPKTKRELVKELATWEKRMGVYSTTSSVGTNIKSKEFNRDEWSVSHSRDFEELISRARRSSKKAAGTTTQTIKPAKDVSTSNADADAVVPRPVMVEAPETAESRLRLGHESAVDQLPRLATNMANNTHGATELIEISDGVSEPEGQAIDQSREITQSPNEVIRLQDEGFQRPEDTMQRQDGAMGIPVGLGSPIMATEGGGSSS